MTKLGCWTSSDGSFHRLFLIAAASAVFRKTKEIRVLYFWQVALAFFLLAGEAERSIQRVCNRSEKKA
jgi:hypothetical protein